MIKNKQVTDLFGNKLKSGDIILRASSGAQLLPCIVTKISYNKLGQPVRIFTEHPYKDNQWQKRGLSPTAEVAVVSNHLMMNYIGHRSSWYRDFVLKLLERQQELQNE